ncbi:hypothetical protein [Paraburkholderia sp. DHOC27]|uniref:hypothetical protein n=1 Tax=Paraburkholderia sp. DHOC27 TaxID=2303330 RepID=UPI000E3D0EA1|nr:hypothetical protein [Paraburkholderia sp. DHOC27]RFU45002.1 hypothetical protein D0B32_24970 [Paraburkholderia sp. DHOC27]
MRLAAFIPILWIGYTTTALCAPALESVTNCVLGSDRSHKFELLRGHAIDSTAVYFFRQDDAAPVPLYSGDEDQSRGEVIQTACVGTKERIFVMSGEFNSNFIQGVAVRFNNKARRWERIDFAERNRPTAVYLGAQGMKILIPNGMRNESRKRYIIYRFDAAKGNGEQSYSNRLPDSQSVRIPLSKNQ